MGTLIRILDQGARGPHAHEGVPAGPGVSLPSMAEFKARRVSS
ncbi:MAG: hypothetical protein ACREXK_01995 [Gammaproteobacteria bacterium]